MRYAHTRASLAFSDSGGAADCIRRFEIPVGAHVRKTQQQATAAFTEASHSCKGALPPPLALRNLSRLCQCFFCCLLFQEFVDALELVRLRSPADDRAHKDCTAKLPSGSATPLQTRMPLAAASNSKILTTPDFSPPYADDGGDSEPQPIPTQSCDLCRHVAQRAVPSMAGNVHVPSYKANFDEDSPDGEEFNEADLTTLILNAHQAAAAAMHAVADASPEARGEYMASALSAMSLDQARRTAVPCLLGDTPDGATVTHDQPAFITRGGLETDASALVLALERTARQWEHGSLRTTPTPLCVPSCSLRSCSLLSCAVAWSHVSARTARSLVAGSAFLLLMRAAG